LNVLTFCPLDGNLGDEGGLMDRPGSELAR
jgi:hypothetical protein